VTDDYRKLNKLGRIPTFEGSDGYILSECIAIAIYRKLHAITTLTIPYWYTHHMMNYHTINYSYPCLKTTVETVFTL